MGNPHQNFRISYYHKELLESEKFYYSNSRNFLQSHQKIRNADHGKSDHEMSFYERLKLVFFANRQFSDVIGDIYLK